jgi:hypothetical protein
MEAACPYPDTLSGLLSLLPRSGYFFERGALELEGFGRDAGRFDCPKGVRFSSSFGARLAISSIAAHHSRDFRSERFRAIGIFSLISLLPSEELV